MTSREREEFLAKDFGSCPHWQHTPSRRPQRCPSCTIFQHGPYPHLRMYLHVLKCSLEPVDLSRCLQPMHSQNTMTDSKCYHILTLFPNSVFASDRNLASFCCLCFSNVAARIKSAGSEYMRTKWLTLHLSGDDLHDTGTLK